MLKSFLRTAVGKEKMRGGERPGVTVAPVAGGKEHELRKPLRKGD